MKHMKTKHTPGPWDFRAATNNDHLASVGAGNYRDALHRVCNVAICTGPNSNNNARLIAAAPELLAALEELLANAVAKQRYIEVLTHNDSETAFLPDTAMDSPEMAMARQAIAKAKGEEP